MSQSLLGHFFRRPPPSPDSRRCRRSNRRFRHALALEILEPRRLLAANVVVSDLLFRGNLLESDGVYSATGTAVQIGFNPTQGETFDPLITLTGNTAIDPLTNTFQFQGTGAFAGMAGPVSFWNSLRLSTFDVPDLIGAGETISGTAFSFGDLVTTASTLTLVNPGGRDTSDSELELDGAGTLTFGTAINGTAPGSPLALSSLNMIITGPGNGTVSGQATGQFAVAATSWSVQGANFHSVVTAGVSTTTLTGAAQATIRGDALAAVLAGPGLTVVAGALTGLDASLSGSTTFAGCPATISGTVTLDNAALDFTGSGSISLGLGKWVLDYDELTFTVARNILTALDASTTSGLPQIFPLKGINVVAVELNTELSLDPVTNNESLSITGTIAYSGDDLNTDTSRSFELSLAGNGIVIRDGAIQDWDCEVTGSIDLADNSLEAEGTRLSYTASDNTYAFSGTMSMTLDGEKEFTKNGKQYYSEPANDLILNCGTEDDPGVVIVDGQLRSLNVSVTTQDGLFDLGGFTFRINDFGLVYQSTPGGGYAWGLYGVISLNNRSSSLKLGDQGFSVGVSLGDRANPGLMITSAWDPAVGDYVSQTNLSNFGFTFSGLYLGPLRISQAHFQYTTDPTDPQLTTLTIGVLASIDGIALGGRITFKNVFNPTTDTYSKQVDAFTVQGGADPGAGIANSWRGIPVASGVYLYQVSGTVQNLTDPNNLVIIAGATFSVGNQVSGVFRDNGKVINTPVHTAIVQGQVSITSTKIWGNINVYIAAYWDEANYAAKLDPWKPLGGTGVGTFLIDWTNNIYQVDFSANLVNLVSGQFEIQISDQGTVIYAMVQVKPTPDGPFDFWPISKIDVSGSFLYLSTDQQNVVGAWVQVRLFGFNWQGGAGYDFSSGRAFLMGSSAIARLLNLKNEALAGPTSAYKATQTYTVTANPGSPEVYASEITATIPFVTSNITASSYQFAAALTPSDIAVAIPTNGSQGDTNVLPRGASFTYRVEMGSTDLNGYTTGTITVDIFPNANQTLNYSNTFFALGVDRLSIDINVQLKQNSFFYNAGDSSDAYMNAVLANPDSYLMGVDTTKTGAARYAKAAWDSSKNVTVGGESYPLIPAMSTSADVASPTVSFANNQLVSSEINSYTNQTQFTLQANASTQTQSSGSVSLLVLDDADLQASRWLIQQTGPWTPGTAAGGPAFVATGSVVEQNQFSQFEILANRADTPFSGGSETINMEVLFFSANRDILKGTIAAVSASSVTIQVQGGGTMTVPRACVEPLWVPMAQVILGNSQPIRTPNWQVYEANYVPTGYVQPQPTGNGKNYYELFTPTAAIRFGQLTPFTSNTVSPNSLMLPTLPHFVTDELLALGDNGVNKFFPINASTGLKTLAPGLAVPLVSLNGVPSTESSILPLGDFTSGGTQTIVWRENELTPTPKWAYLMIDDGINQPAFSNFMSFTPSVNLAGRVLLQEAPGVTVPYAGLTVYIDLNHNGVLDSPEPFVDLNYDSVYAVGDPFVDLNGNGVRDTYSEPYTVTNAQGQYYFYDVAPGNYTIGFVLPDDQVPVSGPASVNIARGAETLTTVPDFTAESLYPVIQGRVVVDSNQNGKADPGEAGFDQAYVVVTGANGHSITSLTDNEGYYSITLDDPSFGSNVTVSVRGDAYNPNVVITPTLPGDGSEVVPVDFLKPTITTTNFAVQAQEDFQFDANASPFENLVNYLQLFLDGGLTGVSFSTAGFEFHVDRFQLLAPQANGDFGIASASGRAIFGGQQFNFVMNGPQGLVVNGPTLVGMNLSLSGDFDIFGAQLNLSNLAVRYTAASPTLGTPARISLSGSTALDIGGNVVTVTLPGDGLVLSDHGIQSLNVRLSGSLLVGGQAIDLGSLQAVYDSVTDSLRLTGRTQLLNLATSDGNSFGLSNVVMVIAQGRITTLQASLSGALSLDGADVSLSSLTFQYQAAGNQFQVYGQSTLTLGENVLTLSLPNPGIVFSAAGIAVNGRVTGDVTLGGFRLMLNDLSLNSTANALGIRGNASLLVNGNAVALAGMDLRFGQGRFQSLIATGSGVIDIDQAVVALDNMRVSYQAGTQSLALTGAAALDLKNRNPAPGAKQTDLVARMSGALTLGAGTVESLQATIEAGTLAMAGGSLQLNSLSFGYNLRDESFSFTGMASLTIDGAVLSASLPAPGIVWKNGFFSSLSAGLSGSLPLSQDHEGKTTSELTLQNLNAVYLPGEGKLTLKGGVGLRVGNSLGVVQTDATGIVVAANTVQAFSGLVTLNLAFGSHTNAGANNNRTSGPGAPSTTASGWSLDVTRAGIAYSSGALGGSSRFLLTGKATLVGAAFGGLSGGVTVDMSSPGIEVINGAVQNFSLAVSAGFSLDSLKIAPNGALGFRYLSSRSEIDIFGSAGVSVNNQAFALALGTGWNNPGIRLQYGAITYASAAFTGGFHVAGLRFETRDAGFTYDASQSEWGVFGLVSAANVFSAAVSLGTRQAPGLLIQQDNWQLNGLTLRAAGVDLGAFKLNDLELSFAKAATSWQVYAACDVVLPMGVGAYGSFAVTNAGVSAIKVGLTSETGVRIPETPLFVTSIDGSLENLTNPSRITLSGTIGIMAGLGAVLQGRSVRMTQFVGAFTLDQSGLVMRADAYVGAINYGTASRPQWVGLIAHGTAVVSLNWAVHQYYADAHLNFASGLFLATGRITFDAASSMTLRGKAAVAVPGFVPIFGGTILASANFLFVMNDGGPIYAVGWTNLLGFDHGIKYDFLTGQTQLVGDGEIRRL